MHIEHMRIGPLISLLSSTYGVPEATTVLIARTLREAGFLTTGARGVNAPEMTLRDVARLTLALLTGEAPGKLVDEFVFMSALQTKEIYPAEAFVSSNVLTSDHTLEEAITAIFASMSDPQRFDQVSIRGRIRSMPPHVSIAVDSSRRAAQIGMSNFSADYTDLRGHARVDELYATTPMTLEAFNEIQAIEDGSVTSFDSSSPLPGRGMRVIRSITEREINTVCAAIRHH